MEYTALIFSWYLSAVGVFPFIFSVSCVIDRRLMNFSFQKMDDEIFNSALTSNQTHLLISNLGTTPPHNQTTTLTGNWNTTFMVNVTNPTTTLVGNRTTTLIENVTNPTVTHIGNWNTTLIENVTNPKATHIGNWNITLIENVTNPTATHIGNWNTTFMENFTSVSYNNKTTFNTDNTDKFFWVAFAFTLEMIVSICCNAVAIRVMMQCRKLPISIRYLSVNLLAAMLIGSCSNVIHSVWGFIIGPHGDNGLQFESRSFFNSVFVSLTWCCLCFVILERFFALTFPLRYAHYATKASLYIAIALIWLVNILVPTLIFIFNWLSTCGQYDFVTSCDRFAMHHPSRIFMISVLFLYCGITVVVYTKISRILHRQNTVIQAITVTTQDAPNQTSSLSRSLPSTKVILVIVLSFIMLQSPLVLTIFLFELRPDLQEQQLRSFLFGVIFLFSEINTYVVLYFYIWRFRECRMNFYRMLSIISDRYKDKAGALHIEVFNIVTVKTESSV